MAQYTESTSGVVDTLTNSGLSSETSSAITDIISADDETNIQDYDGTTAEEGTDIITVGSDQALTTDPGSPIIIIDKDAPAATVALDTSTSDRVLVAGSGDDTITTEGEGNVTVETGGGNDSITTGAGQDEIIITGSGNSSVSTGDGNDTIKMTGDGTPTIDAGDGNDVIIVDTDQGSATVDGGDGFDEANVDDSRGEHSITIEDGIITLNSAPIQLDNIEVVEFNDGISILAEGSLEAAVGRLYEVLFDREADLAGLEYWSGMAEEGDALEHIAASMMASNEYTALHGSQTNSEFIDSLYESTFGREADTGGKDYWLGRMEDGMTQAELASCFADSDEAVQLMGIDGTQYVIDIDSGQ